MRVLIVLFFTLACPALAQDRLALVIGNDAYANVPVLEKAVADARAVSAALQAQGYRTITATDQDRRGMNRAISDFTARLQPGDSAVVFFAGHGVEIDGENYLLPTDIVAPAAGESDFVKSESIALSGLLDRVRGTGARTAVMFVDACRNNPFEVSTGRSIGRTRGLGRIVAPQGTFVVFSAGAGQLALDRLDNNDTAANSVFTRALLPRLGEPGLELRSLVSALRLEVRDLAQSVQHVQVPAYYDELLGEFYFAPASAAAPATGPAVAANDTMRDDLRLARDIGTREALDAFLDRYSDRDGDYSYRIAVLLRNNLDTAEPQPAARGAEPEGSPETPAVATDPQVMAAKAIIRETQEQLNALGCRAGGADGVIGPRTRRAFAGFVAGSGSSLAPADLGSAAALVELRQATGTVCAPEPVVAAAPASTGVNLTGRWSYKATCALFVKVTGTVRYTRSGDNFYSGSLSDSLGQTANTEVRLDGRDLRGTDYFPGITVRWRGRLAPDGKSFTSSGTTGCAVYAWRTG